MSTDSKRGSGRSFCCGYAQRGRTAFGDPNDIEEGMNRKTVALAERVRSEVERLYEGFGFGS